MTDDIDIPLLPYDDDAYDPSAPQKSRPAVLGEGFAYVGQACTIDEFAAHVAAYRFGSVPPEYVVLHHTANPDASYAPLNSDPRIKWDRSESGASEVQIRVKRKAQLDAIARYYQSLGWNAGPHLFIDERWIWLFTPMYDVGIHAKSGNSYRSADKKLHYSLGIEVVGYYEKQVWPAKVARNVGMALAILRRRLGTFSLDYRPGPRETPAAHLGSLSSHRDYNKPACPGKAITEAYYTGVAQAAWEELTGRPTAPAPKPFGRYRVLRDVTGGATIRAFPRVNGAALGRLHAGDLWEGEPYEAKTSTFVKGFGSSKIWIRSPDMRYIWSGLLEKVKDS